MRTKMAKQQIELVPGYTAKQSQVIRGEIPLEDVTGQLASQLLKRAIKIGDTTTTEFANRLVEDSKRKVKEKNRERKKARRNGKDIVWKQPKSNEYTEHQKMIIRGEIPIHDVHTKELISIHLKAKNVGDIELSERIYDIIADRRTAEIEKHKREFQSFKQRKKSVFFDIGDEYKKRNYLTQWEKDVLLSKVELAECDTEHLKHILHVCELLEDRHGADLASQLLQFFNNANLADLNIGIIIQN